MRQRGRPAANLLDYLLLRIYRQYDLFIDITTTMFWKRLARRDAIAQRTHRFGKRTSVWPAALDEQRSPWSPPAQLAMRSERRTSIVLRDTG